MKNLCLLGRLISPRPPKHCCSENLIKEDSISIPLPDALLSSAILKARGKPAVLLCDRATFDGKSYLSDEKWNKLLKERGTSEEELRDNRYNAVFHLVTAAEGAETFYTLENNAARSETPEQAKELDRKGQKAWLGHAHMYVIV
jgi:hypothetical protein